MYLIQSDLIVKAALILLVTHIFGMLSVLVNAGPTIVVIGKSYRGQYDTAVAIYR